MNDLAKKVPFGVDKEEAIEALRDLADKLEDGIAFIQRLNLSIERVPDDFSMLTLAITYAERQE
jgi:hypothetical protein